MKDAIKGVDEGMVRRVARWLLGRRNGSGGFSVSEKGYDSFASPPPHTANAYILWVLTTVSDGDFISELRAELDALKAQAARSRDPYIVALAGLALWNSGDQTTAREYAQRLAGMQDASGEVVDADTSITRSRGSSLAIETTSLAALLWMKENVHAASVELAVQFLSKQVKQGRYGST